MNRNRNFLTIYFEIVQVLNSVLGFLSSSELYQRVTFWPLRDMISRYLNQINGTITLKIFTNIRFINMLHFIVVDEALYTYLTVSFFFLRNLIGISFAIKSVWRFAVLLLFLLVDLSLEFVRLSCSVLLSL